MILTTLRICHSVLIMSASESHELRVLSGSSSLPRVASEEERARSTGFEDAIPPENAAQDLRPSRQYQTLLLLSGFMMIFQTIGIGQAYGIFQVGTLCDRYDGLMPFHSDNGRYVSIARNSIHPLKAISRMRLDKMRSFHLWVASVMG